MAAICALRPASFRKVLRAHLLLGLVGGLICAAYLTAVLKVGCIICYIAYVCIVALCLLGWRLGENSSDRALLSKTVSAILLALMLVLLGLYSAINIWRIHRQIPEADFQNWFQSLAPQNVELVSPFKKTAKTGKPKITVAEFSDFGCPFCQQATEIWMPYLESQDDVEIYFFPFPLDAECNMKMTRIVHPHSCEWAKVAVCAEKQGKFWRFHDEIFKVAQDAGELPPLQEGLSDFSFLEKKALEDCLKDPQTEEALKKMIQAGFSSGVESTPTFFVNGRKIEGIRALPLLRRLLQELRK